MFQDNCLGLLTTLILVLLYYYCIIICFITGIIVIKYRILLEIKIIGNMEIQKEQIILKINFY